LTKSLDEAMKQRQNRIQFEQHHNYLQQCAKMSSGRTQAHVGVDMSDDLYELEAMSVVSDISMAATMTTGLTAFLLDPLDSVDDEAAEEQDGSIVQNSGAAAGSFSRHSSQLDGADMPYPLNGDTVSIVSMESGSRASGADLAASARLTPHISFYAVKKGMCNPSALALARSISRTQSNRALLASRSSADLGVVDALRSDDESESRGFRLDTGKERFRRTISVSDFPIARPTSRTDNSPPKPSVSKSVSKPSTAAARVDDTRPRTSDSGGKAGGFVEGWGGHIRSTSPASKTREPLKDVLSVTPLTRFGALSPQYGDLRNNDAPDILFCDTQSDTSSQPVKSLSSPIPELRAPHPIPSPAPSLDNVVVRRSSIALPSIYADAQGADSSTSAIFARPTSPLQPSQEASLYAELDRDREREIRKQSGIGVVVNLGANSSASNLSLPGDNRRIKKVNQVRTHRGFDGLGDDGSVTSISVSSQHRQASSRPNSRSVNSSSGSPITMIATAVTARPKTSAGVVNAATIQNLKKEFFGRG
jgi:hypothetical protein